MLTFILGVVTGVLLLVIWVDLFTPDPVKKEIHKIIDKEADK